MKKTNQEKLNDAVKLLREVSQSMEGERGINIKFYPEILPSFDELVEDIAGIELTN